MLSGESLQDNCMYHSYLTRRLFNGGRAFCLKNSHKENAVFYINEYRL
jgi:hypothetical protein